MGLVLVAMQKGSPVPMLPTILAISSKLLKGGYVGAQGLRYEFVRRDYVGEHYGEEPFVTWQ